MFVLCHIAVQKGITPCSSDSFCAMNIPNSVCTSANVCDCPFGYISSADNTSCISVMAGSRQCSVTSDCTLFINSSVCIEDVCQCPLGYKAQNGNTHCSIRYMGDSCSVPIDCSAVLADTTCSVRTSVCICAIGYRPTTDGVACDKGINSMKSQVNTL